MRVAYMPSYMPFVISQRSSVRENPHSSIQHPYCFSRNDIYPLDITETGSVLDHLVKLDPSERAAYLETSKELEDFYAKAALSGRLEAPPAEDEVDHHYICLVKSSGQLYELDGDMDGPISRGCLTGGDDVLTKPGLDIVRRYTESQEDGRFGLLALVDG